MINPDKNSTRNMGFITGGPTEAIVVSGCFHSKPLIVVGGWAFVCPCVQKVQRLPLALMTLVVASPRVYTMHGVPLSVTGIAQVKITSNNEEMLRSAVEQFGDKSDQEIQDIARTTLEGHQRAIMGAMTVDEIFKDRKKFSEQVFDCASTDLFNMGIQVISYTLRDIKDEENYMESMGQARTSEVRRDARIGEAECNRDSLIQTALAEETRIASKMLNDTEMELYKRNFEIKKAAYDMEVETARAQAELAFQLQAAKVHQRIKEEKMNIEIVDRMNQIEIQEKEIERRQRELHSRIKAPADAEKYKCEILADANKKRAILEAGALAEAVAMKGDAEAFAIEAKAKAEAEQMAMKADAFKEYNKAAKVEMWMTTLPKMAAEVAAPMSQCEKVTMIMDMNETPGKGSGPSKMTQEVINIMMNIPDSVSASTGVNLRLKSA